MQITVEAPPDRAAMTRAIRHVLKRWMLLTRFIGLDLLLLAALKHDDPLVAGLLLGVGVAFVVVVPGLRVRKVAQQWWTVAGRPFTYRMDDWGIEAVSELSSGRTAWQLVERVEVIEGLLIIRYRGFRFAVVPRAGLTREEIGEITAAVAKARAGQETMAA